MKKDIARIRFYMHMKFELSCISCFVPYQMCRMLWTQQTSIIMISVMVIGFIKTNYLFLLYRGMEDLVVIGYIDAIFIHINMTSYHNMVMCFL